MFENRLVNPNVKALYYNQLTDLYFLYKFE
jgi:hypothetical protein